MRTSIAHALAAAALGALMVLSAAPASAKTAKECEAEYAANKVAIQGAKQKKADFITACRAGTEVIPTAATPAPAATTPAPAASPAPATAVAPSGANQFASEAQASSHCPGGTVVWVNPKSKIYHFAGTRDYGHTKEGAYMCEADATAAGDRAAKNEKHP
jgi:hypothetical protein